MKRKKRLLGIEKFDMKLFKVELVLVELGNGFVVFLFFENLLHLCDLPIFPHNGVFELFNPSLEVDWALESSAAATLNCHRVQLAGNGFAAFTDIENVLTGMAAVLDLAEAEGLSVGGGWVHMAMILLGVRLKQEILL